jgi:hypothetical protein
VNKYPKYDNPIKRLLFTIKAGERAREILETSYYKITDTPTHWSLKHKTTDDLVSDIILTLRKKEGR